MSELPDHEPTGVESVDRVLAEVAEELVVAPVAAELAAYRQTWEGLRKARA